MAITLYSASVPVFIQYLGNLRHLIQKAEEDVLARQYDEQALVDFRLAPDMFPFRVQICIACDAAKLCASRISGLEAPKYENTENTLAELIGRIDKTVEWLHTVPSDRIEGQKFKEITFTAGKGTTRTMLAEDYVKTWALPNMFFHITTAYAILRHNGVDVGKIDYLIGAEL
jgi:hypothetical protein